MIRRLVRRVLHRPPPHKHRLAWQIVREDEQYDYIVRLGCLDCGEVRWQIRTDDLTWPGMLQSAYLAGEISDLAFYGAPIRLADYAS